MPLFEVAFTLVPSIKAQEAGQEEQIVLGPTAVCAKDMASAIAVVAGGNGDKIKPVDGSTLRPHCRPFPSTA